MLPAHDRQPALHRGADAAQVAAAVTDLAENGQDPDARTALRWQIKRALRDDPQFANELSAMLPERLAVMATGERSVSAGSNSGIISTGDGAKNTLYR